MSEPQRTPNPESTGWTDDDWEILLQDIRHQRCTPFLGAGACAGVVPLGREIALGWADQFDYPFSDRDNLARVAQFVAAAQVPPAPIFPKYNIIDRFRKLPPPDFSDPNEPHRVVADLQLPVYITTNYDDYMMRALQRDSRQPRREVCKWNLAGRRLSLKPDADLNPSRENPVVYHLHGTLDDARSMVLTEDDYLDFLMQVSQESTLLPPRIEQAFTESSLLFLGYSLEDLNFRVLFRKLFTYIQRSQASRHVSVQLAPQSGRAEQQRDYLVKHFNLQSVKVYFGTCHEFAAELRQRMEGSHA